MACAIGCRAAKNAAIHVKAEVYPPPFFFDFSHEISEKLCLEPSLRRSQRLTTPRRSTRLPKAAEAHLQRKHWLVYELTQGARQQKLSKLTKAELPPPFFLAMASLAEFDSTLRAIADELGAREVHLATLGSRIRARLPGFNAGAHGHTSFTELCQSRTEVGVVKFGEKPEDRWFVFHDPLESQPPRQFQFVQSHSQVAQPVWDACVDIESTHRAWLDFMDYGRIVTDAEEIEAEPERYVELPRFDRTKQAELLKAFAESCGKHMQPTLRELADAWGSGTSPYSQLLEELTRCGLRHQWFARLRQVVEQDLRKWAADHGIPPGELFKRIVPSKPPPRANTPIVPHELALNEHEFRSFLKAAIDEMTLAELSQWSIPARLLLRK